MVRPWLLLGKMYGAMKHDLCDSTNVAHEFPPVNLQSVITFLSTFMILVYVGPIKSA